MSNEVLSSNATVASYSDGPRLLADIGGTNARFALEASPGAISHIRVLPCEQFAGVKEAIEHYLQVEGSPSVSRAAVAIANPVDGDFVQMTNHHWAFSIDETRRALKLKTFLVANDFTALAMALPKLSPSEWIQFGPGVPRKDAPMGLLGPGTGLGVSGLIRAKDRWIALESEGGHVSFAPTNEREDIVLKYARSKWEHVSFERIAAGPGLGVIYDALATARGEDELGLTPAQVTERAMRGDEVARDAASCFSGILGSFAGNLALTLGAKGGVYLGGGVVGRLGDNFDQLSFRQAFAAKGRFQSFIEGIPTYLITAEYPAFSGVSAILDATVR